MVVIRAYHGTTVDYARMIECYGLEARKPADFNYSYLTGQPKGVYVALNPDPYMWWTADRYFEVTYCGPLMEDPELRTAWRGQAAVIPFDIPRDALRSVPEQERQQALLDYVPLRQGDRWEFWTRST